MLRPRSNQYRFEEEHVEDNGHTAKTVAMCIIALLYAAATLIIAILYAKLQA